MFWQKKGIKIDINRLKKELGQTRTQQLKNELNTEMYGIFVLGQTLGQTRKQQLKIEPNTIEVCEISALKQTGIDELINCIKKVSNQEQTNQPQSCNNCKTCIFKENFAVYIQVHGSCIPCYSSKGNVHE